MNIDLIKEVSMYGGVLKPNGEKYIPSSLGELNKIIGKIASYAFSASSFLFGVGGPEFKPEEGERNSFISFRLETMYYIDMKTVHSEIRENQINRLI